jgi:L1 cell adhesion molecule like protein
MDAEQYEAEQKKLEGIVAPIVSKLYGGGGGGGGGGGHGGQDQSSHSASEPSIEEVD